MAPRVASRFFHTRARRGLGKAERTAEKATLENARQATRKGEVHQMKRVALGPRPR